MISTDDDHQSYPLIKQSKVRKLPRYTSSISSSGSGSSANNSPNSNQHKTYYHHFHPNGDTDEGYASFTTNNTTLCSNNSSTLNRDDSAYYTFGSDRLLTTTTSSSSSSRILVESDSDKSEISDEDDELENLVDWSSLNQQVQALVSRFDKWLHNPLPDRCIPIQKSYVEHAYPVLQRRTSSIPHSINLATEDSNHLPHQSNYIINFVQKNKISRQNSLIPLKIPRPRVHFNLQTEQVLLKLKTKTLFNFFYFISSFSIVQLVRDLFN